MAAQGTIWTLALCVVGCVAQQNFAVCSKAGGTCRQSCLAGEQKVSTNEFACPSIVTGPLTSCCGIPTTTAASTTSTPATTTAASTTSTPATTTAASTMSAPTTTPATTAAASTTSAPTTSGMTGSGNTATTAMSTTASSSTSSNVTAWAHWSPCSVSCGTNGLRQHSRNCTNPAGCSEPLNEKQPCNATTECPTVGPWSSWSSCSVTCGNGTSTRTRSCIKSGGGCTENLKETMSCSTNQTCPEVGPWSDWSSCSVTCGMGTMTRTRSCIKAGGGCTENLTETMSCTTESCPEWTEWSPWGDCSVTCGEGTIYRARDCYSPDTGDTLDAGLCGGNDTETMPCNEDICPDPVCGRPIDVSQAPGPRIFNGMTPEPGANPWLTSFEIVLPGPYRSITCTGVLVDQNSILTTSMCAKSVDIAQQLGGNQVAVIGNYYTKDDIDGVEFNVMPTDVIYPPDYTLENSNDYDNLFTKGEYAIIQLNRSLTKEEDGVNYICLAEPSRDIDWSTCMVLGFGYANETADGNPITPDTLLQASANLQNADFCDGNFAFDPSYPGSGVFNDTSYCGSRPSGYTLCLGGDEGAIMSCRDQYGQVVVAALGRVDGEIANCNHPKESAVYARVDTEEIVGWIKNTTEANN